MSLAPGTRLGPYEVLSAVGAGGMGEVYRARDTRLDRVVAVKVLPGELSANSELRQRFEREARAISSLSHPHICHLYDIGHQNGVDYLVMEYLEGETVSERLARGALPLSQAISVAVEVAGALEKAHRAGIVHRDLKPANIILTKTGAKLLDFGLAKPLGAIGTAVGGGALTPSTPTMSLRNLTSPAQDITQQGSIVGTFQYMAPEVLQGAEADTRSDIFGFGCVLYEMIAGKRAFEGKSQVSVAAAILEKDPEPLSKIEPATPRALEHVVARCLAKTPDERWQTAHDLRKELEWIPASVQSAAPAQAPKRRLWIWMLGALSAVLILGGLAARYVEWRAPAAVTRAYLLPPANSFFHFIGNAGGPIMISPDGKRVVYGAMSEGHAELWVQSLDSLLPQRLRGTERAMFPFWSPDGRYVAFFADGKLKKIDVVGGAPETICDAPVGRGGAWSADGFILFSPHAATSIYRVSAQGGTATPVTTLDASRGETTHRWPELLPDGRHFLYLAANPASSETDESNAIYLGSLDSPARTRIVSARSNPVYAGGYILYVHSGTLYALPFDARRLKPEGDPIVVAEGVQTDPAFSRATFAASRNGVLVYAVGGGNDDMRQLTWYDIAGKKLGTVGDRQRIFDLRLSPDGKMLASAIDTGRLDLWLYDLVRQTITPFTRGTGEHFPVWSPDGKRIAYNTDRDGLIIAPTDSSGPPQVISDDTTLHATDWSRDGKYLAASRFAQKLEIWGVPLEGDRKPFRVVATESNNSDANFSPDGRWIVYDSPQSGQSEIYVTRFPGPGPRYQVSNAGGDLPRWSRDGRTIFYLDANRLEFMAADVQISRDSLTIGKPRSLFSPKPDITYLSADYSYDISPDGKRFLLLTGVDQQPARAAVVVNWTSDLKK